MNRKVVVLATAMGLALGLAGCSGSGDNGADPTTDAPATDAPATDEAKGGRLVYIQSGADAFTIPLGCSAKARAQELGYSLDIAGPLNYETAEQVSAVNSVTASKPAGVLLHPVDPEALLPAAIAMADAGIPFVEVDSTLADDTLSYARIASDNIGMGAQSAHEMADRLGGEGLVLVLVNTPGLTTLDQRTSGFVDTMASDYPNIEVVGPLYANGSVATAQQNFSSSLSRYPNLAGVYATDLVGGQGAATGIKAANKAGEIVFSMIDATSEAVEMLQEGVVSFIVSQNPSEIGRIGVEQLVNVIEGKPVDDRNIVVGSGVVTAENLETPEIQEYVYRETSC